MACYRHIHRIHLFALTKFFINHSSTLSTHHIASLIVYTLIHLFAFISIYRITLAQLIVCQIYQKPIIRSSTMTTRTTMIEEACDDGNDFSHHEWLHVRGEGGHDLLSKKPLLFSYSTTWEAANLMISLSCAPRLLFLVNFHESRACNSLSCIVFDPFTHSLFCLVPPVPWQCRPCSLCPW